MIIYKSEIGEVFYAISASPIGKNSIRTYYDALPEISSSQARKYMPVVNFDIYVSPLQGDILARLKQHPKYSNLGKKKFIVVDDEFLI